MRTPLFHLKGTVGRTYRVDPEDTRRAKQALFELGYFDVPDYGLTDYPDEPLFKAIEAYQADYGLYRDGIMRPDGETATSLAQSLAEAIGQSRSVAGESASAHRDHGRASQILLGQQTADASVAAKADEQMAMMRRRDNGIVPSSPADIVPPLIIGGGAAGLLKTPARNDYDIIDPLPPIPPSQPTKVEQGYREELLPTSLLPIDLMHPIPEDQPPGIYIHPVPDEELAKLGQIVENRRGNDLTKAELDRLRDQILKSNPKWKHVAGGRDAVTGDELGEYHIAGPGRKIANNVHVGGHYADLTFVTENGRRIHIQSVDVDRHGKPTARELKNAEQIRILDPGSYVILHPKAHQLAKRSRK